MTPTLQDLKALGQLRDLGFEFADALPHRLTTGAGRASSIPP
jgi:hypothetical protein